MQKVSPVQLQGLQIVLQPLVIALCHGAGTAEPLELVNVKEKRDIRVPGVVPGPANDERVAGGAVQLVQGRAHPVKHGLEGIEGIGAALAVTPQKSHQLILGDGTAAAIDHVCQQQPYFSGAVVVVVDLLVTLADRKVAEHPHFKDMIRHLTSPPFSKTFHA